MTATLLQTKLYRPTPRPDLVPRQRLLQQLLTGLWTGQAFARKLTLVAAPAGFGKTTLILNCGLWTSNPAQPKPAIENLKSGWLSLDEADNDPARFLRYVIAALQSALPEVGRAALPVLESGVPTELEEALAGIINEIAAAVVCCFRLRWFAGGDLYHCQHRRADRLDIHHGHLHETMQQSVDRFLDSLLLQPFVALLHRRRVFLRRHFGAVCGGGVGFATASAQEGTCTFVGIGMTAILLR